MFDKPRDYSAVVADFREILRGDAQSFKIRYWDGTIDVITTGKDSPNPVSALGVRMILDQLPKRHPHFFIYDAPPVPKDRLDAGVMNDLYFDLQYEDWGRIEYRDQDDENHRLFWIAMNDETAAEFTATYHGKNKKPEKR
ncbi:hypothetical protein QM996_02510 [Sinorhizobium chiapasense]